MPEEDDLGYKSREDRVSASLITANSHTCALSPSRGCDLRYNPLQLRTAKSSVKYRHNSCASARGSIPGVGRSQAAARAGRDAGSIFHPMNPSDEEDDSVT
jgi:hypothetical protein